MNSANVMAKALQLDRHLGLRAVGYSLNIANFHCNEKERPFWREVAFTISNIQAEPRWLPWESR